MKLSYIIYFVLSILFVFSISCIFYKDTEGFHIRPDIGFSVYDEHASFYETMEKPTLNTKNASENVTQHKRGPFLQSYSQENNHKRFWKTPDNGTCIPSDICNSMYNEIENKTYGIAGFDQSSVSSDAYNFKRVGTYTQEQNDTMYL